MSRKRILIIVGIVVAAVAITVVLDAVLANHRPAITNLGAELERVLPSGTCQIVCNATDRDGDELSYNWSASAGQLNGEGATVTWTAPATAGSYNVTVVVTDSRGGQVTQRVTIEVRANRAPAITSLGADADWTLPSGSLQLICTASDPDGDELSYGWTATGGDISGTGTAVNWTAPEEVDVYDVTVVVTDGHGRSDTRTLPLSVVTGEPPTIEELRITKDRYGHCYLKKSGDKYLVGKGQMYDLECVVTDTSAELFYEWSWTAGNASLQDSLIAWTAPDTSTTVTITVMVSDIAGNMVSKNLLLTVVSCSTCTFGHCPG